MPSGGGRTHSSVKCLGSCCPLHHLKGLAKVMSAIHPHSSQVTPILGSVRLCSHSLTLYLPLPSLSHSPPTPPISQFLHRHIQCERPNPQRKPPSLAGLHIRSPRHVLCGVSPIHPGITNQFPSKSIAHIDGTVSV